MNGNDLANAAAAAMLAAIAGALVVGAILGIAMATLISWIF